MKLLALSQGLNAIFVTKPLCTFCSDFSCFIGTPWYIWISLSSPVTSFSMHAGGVNCAIGSESGEVLVYDLRQSAPLASTYTSGAVTCLQFAPLPKTKKSTEPPRRTNLAPPKQTTTPNRVFQSRDQNRSVPKQDEKKVEMGASSTEINSPGMSRIKMVRAYRQCKSRV